MTPPLTALLTCRARLFLYATLSLALSLGFSPVGLAQDVELKCKFSERTWKAAIEMTNATSKPVICSALCVFGNLERQTETLTLECNAFILPSFSRKDYCVQYLAKSPGEVLRSRRGCRSVNK